MKINGRNGNSMAVAEKWDSLALPENPRILLVRCWNKSADGGIRALVKRWAMQEFRIDAILVVIDGDKDNTGSSPIDTVAAVESIGNAPMPLIPILVHGPSDVPNWTRMLNAGLAYLKALGVADGQLVCSSFETEFDQTAFLAAVDGIDTEWGKDEFKQMPFISLRETPANIALPEATALLSSTDPGAEVMKIIDSIHGYLVGNCELGDWAKALPVVCRNTLMMWSIKALLAHNGFDPRCSVWKGQEDSGMMIKFLCSHGFSDLTLNPKRIVRFTDPRLHVVEPEKIAFQQGKMNDEWNATQKMFEAFREDFKKWGHWNTFVTPEPDFDLTM